MAGFFGIMNTSDENVKKSRKSEKRNRNGKFGHDDTSRQFASKKNSVKLHFLITFNKNNFFGDFIINRC